MYNFVKLIISIAVCELSGVISAIFTRSSVLGWYRTIHKPSFNPPNWVFAPVWITLYLIMGISLFLIWKKGFKFREVKYATSIFAVQLMLNFLWSIAFFGLHSISGGMIIIILLWVSIIFVIFSFHNISKVSAYILTPYLLWVSFAGVLNYFILMYN